MDEGSCLGAEAVASLSCSGHGRAFLDGPTGLDGKRICECYSCYGGPNCSEFSPECPADAQGGDPLFLESYWLQNAASIAVVMAGWHRMSSVLSYGSFISIELRKLIQRLHAVVGNANTTDRFIIFGDGSTQLFNAAVHALSEDGFSHPATVVASVPYYQDILTKEIIGRGTKRGGLYYMEDFSLGRAHHTSSTLGSKARQIWLWHRRLGHPSFGWALIKDEDVYQTMNRYSQLNTMGASRDTQLRAFKLLKAVLRDGGRDIFEFGHNRMNDRWRRLNNILSISSRFSLQKLAPQYCSFFQKNRDPSPGAFLYKLSPNQLPCP